jgi:hypothetical protein
MIGIDGAVSEGGIFYEFGVVASCVPLPIDERVS